ncbi:MAG: plasmid pRiA4b ORF-3 family protein [Lentisphaeria bacterium]|nr:plasmid pRiA4b ORF-3 family protein [Lentisphaeria bacterium]
MSPGKNSLVYQFKITLQEIEPPIWRRIQVPASYSFWDLHVANQDAMGWLDYHLHAFRFRPKHKQKPIEIGIPCDDGFDEYEVIPGWDVPITRYLDEPGQAIEYEYDFGDSWHHEILFEGILLKEKGEKYPKCLAGERACPPEDCGSVHGYHEVIEILQDSDNPDNEEYAETVAWLKAHPGKYHPYDPDVFDPDKVHFDNPKKRWNHAFAED